MANKVQETHFDIESSYESVNFIQPDVDHEIGGMEKQRQTQEGKFCCCFPRKKKEKRESSDKGVLVILVGLIVFSLAYYFSRSTVYTITQLNQPTWSYDCEDGKCIRGTNASSFKTFSSCKMFCASFGTLWPKPNGVFSRPPDTSLVNFLPGDVRLVLDKAIAGVHRESLMDFLKYWLKTNLFALHPRYKGDRVNPYKAHTSHSRVVVNLNLKQDNLSSLNLDLNTSEAYELYIQKIMELDKGDFIRVVITAKNYFGIRHGLETFAQLTTFDDITETLQIYNKLFMQDSPAFPFRSLSIDTSSGFVPLSQLRMIIRTASANKFNFMNWKVAGVHSVPLLFPIRPSTIHIQSLSLSPAKVYNAKEISKVIDYGIKHGVVVLPEFSVSEIVSSPFFKIPQLMKASRCLSSFSSRGECQKLCSKTSMGSAVRFLRQIYEVVLTMFDGNFFNLGVIDPDLSKPNCLALTNMTWQDMQSEAWTLATKRVGRKDIVTLSQSDEVYPDSQSLALVVKQTGNGLGGLVVQPWPHQLLQESKDRVIKLFPSIQLGLQPLSISVVSRDQSCEVTNFIHPGCTWYWDKFFTSKHHLTSSIICQRIIKTIRASDGHVPLFKGLQKDGKSSVLGAQVDVKSHYNLHVGLNLLGLADNLWSEDVREVLRLQFHIHRLHGRGIQAKSFLPDWCFMSEKMCLESLIQE